MKNTPIICGDSESGSATSSKLVLIKKVGVFLSQIPRRVSFKLLTPGGVNPGPGVHPALVVGRERRVDS